MDSQSVVEVLEERGELTPAGALWAAFRIGRDVEAHAHEAESDCANYDAVTEYATREMDALIAACQS
jgi:hypothetical protein